MYIYVHIHIYLFFFVHSHTQNAPNPHENSHGALTWKLDAYRNRKGEWRPPKGNPEGHTKAGRVNSDSFELDSICNSAVLSPDAKALLGLFFLE